MNINNPTQIEKTYEDLSKLKKIIDENIETSQKGQVFGMDLSAAVEEKIGGFFGLNDNLDSNIQESNSKFDEIILEINNISETIEENNKIIEDELNQNNDEIHNNQEISIEEKSDPENITSEIVAVDEETVIPAFIHFGIFTKNGCPACIKMKSEFNDREVPYIEYPLYTPEWQKNDDIFQKFEENKDKYKFTNHIPQLIPVQDGLIGNLKMDPNAVELYDRLSSLAKDFSDCKNSGSGLINCLGKFFDSYGEFINELYQGYTIDSL